MKLRNKVVVVTGGTHALGRRIAEAMLIEGACVVCAARSEREMDRIREIGGRRAAYHPVDVRDPASVEALFAFAADRYGSVDVLVANAGVSRDGGLRKLAPEDFRDVMETNVFGAFTCLQAAIPYFEAAGGGRVVNISSALSTRVAPGAGAYSASKAALDMLTKVSAAELGELNVTVNALAPGFIDEGMGSRLADNDLAMDAYRGRFISGRLGTGAEVGRAAVFLASEESSYVNGHVLEVNGGLLWN